MKKYVSILLATVLMIILSYADSYATEPFETVTQYFNASQRGDVEAMKQLIAGPFLENRRVLLEMNKNYPDFLKKFYDGAIFEAFHYDIGNDNMVKTKYFNLYNKYYSAPTASSDDNFKNGNNYVSVVIVKILFRDGSKVKYEYLLKKADSDSWKIYDEVLIDNLPISSD